jgi:hypothetical protein
MVRKGVFRRLSSLVQRRATVVRDTVRIEASQLCHAAAAGWRTDPRVRDIGDEFMFDPPFSLLRRFKETRVTGRCICPVLLLGTIFGRDRHTRVIVRSKRTPLWIVFRSSCVLVQFFLLVRKLNMPTKSQQDRSNCGFIRERTAPSRYTRTQAIATTMRKEFTLSSPALVPGKPHSHDWRPRRTISRNTGKHSDEYCLGVQRARRGTGPRSQP